MKVDITLTVGGNDVTIDYSEGKTLFDELKDLYEPGSSESQPYGVMDGFAPAPPSCGSNKINNDMPDETIEEIKNIEANAETDYIDEELITVADDKNINTEIVDAEIAERMKAMQKIIDKMNT